MKLTEEERVRRIAAYRAWRDEMANRPPPLIDPGMGRVITSEQIWLAAWSAAAQAERDECAKIADDFANASVMTKLIDPPRGKHYEAAVAAAETIAKDIRSRARPSDESRT